MQVIIGIVLFVVALYLYYLFCRWLFVAVAPELLVLGSVLGTGVLPAIYGIGAVRVFDRDSWRRVFWLPVFVLLFLMWVDLAFLSVLAMASVPAANLPALTQALAPLAAGAPPTVFLVEVARDMHAPLWALILGGLVAKGVLIAPLLILVRGLANDVQDASQPARRQYFFSQALTDLGTTITWAWETLTKVITAAAIGIWTVSAGPQAFFIWPLTVTAYVTLLPPVIGALLATTVLVVAHAVGVFAVMLVNAFLALLLYTMERAVILARRGHAKCPHAGCHQPVPLPVFMCPSCGARHDRLVPGRCGLLYRACKCGAHLPTLFFLGKGKLPAACSHPKCGGPLGAELFSGSVHLPIYGAPSSGKTMFMMAATWQAMEQQWPGVRITFVRQEDRNAYDTAWKPNFEAGSTREKTAEKLPDAFTLAIKRTGGVPLSLYMYDPAGEAMTDSEQIQGHRFLEYFDGLALLLDPLSLPTLARAHLERGGVIQDSTTTVEPLDLLHHVVNVLEAQAKLVRHKRYSRRIAVIISKADLPVVRDELGLQPSDGTPGEQWRELGLAQSERIRTWLGRNEPALLQVLDTRFADLRFFASSALGHEPNGRPFVPRNVLQPLSWLLSGRPALARPKLARWIGQFAEWGAALTVLALFLAPLAIGAAFGYGQYAKHARGKVVASARSRAQTCSSSGDNECALRAWGTVLSSNRGDLQALVGRCDARMHLYDMRATLSDCAAALHALERRSGSTAHVARIRAHRVAVYESLSEDRQAVDEIGLLLSLPGADKTQWLMRRARTHLRLGDAEAALRDLDASIGASTSSAVEAHRLRETTLLDMGRAQATLPDIDALLAQDSSNASLLMKRGRLLLAAGEMDRARQDFNSVLAINKKNVGALIGLGDVGLAASHAKLALAYFRRALKVERNSMAARSGVAHVYVLMAMGSDSAQALRKIDDRGMDPVDLLRLGRGEAALCLGPKTKKRCDAALRTKMRTHLSTFVAKAGDDPRRATVEALLAQDVQDEQPSAADASGDMRSKMRKRRSSRVEAQDDSLFDHRVKTVGEAQDDSLFEQRVKPVDPVQKRVRKPK